MIPSDATVLAPVVHTSTKSSSAAITPSRVPSAIVGAVSPS